MGRQEALKLVGWPRLWPALLSPAPCFQTVRRTKDSIRRTSGQSTSDRDPGAASLAANKFFRLLITRIRASRACLLEVAQGFNELLDELEVRAEPPEQQNQQQGNQGDNYQVLQIPFSAVMRRTMMALPATKPGSGALATYLRYVRRLQFPYRADLVCDGAEKHRRHAGEEATC
jgi:hypothetical protein